MNRTTLTIKKDDSTTLGARVVRGGTVFTSSLGEYARSFLILVNSGKTIARIPLSDYHVCGKICSVRVEGLPEGTGYYYTAGSERIADPYAFLIRKGICFPGPKDADSCMRDTAEAKKERIYYKLHVRGFTKTDPSVPENERGTFTGLIRKIDYIKGLGADSIILMPPYACDRTLPGRKTNYWGYARTNYYFSPESSFAVSDPVAEVKELFAKIHEAGMGVFPEFYFPDDADPFLVRQALRHWIYFYGADGFVLRGDHRMIRYALSDPGLYGHMMIIAGRDPGEFQDIPAADLYGRKFFDTRFMKGARELLRGTPGYAPAFTSYFNQRADQSETLVRYITDHDGFTLRDLVSYDEKHNEENGELNRDGPSENYSWNCGAEGPTRSRKIRELRLRQSKNMLAYLLLAPGDVMLLSGDEMGNTQHGNNNAYCMDNQTGWIDWKSASKEQELTEFVRKMIRIRKNFFAPNDDGDKPKRRMVFPELSVHSERAFYPDPVLPAGAVLGFKDALNDCDRKVLYMALNAHSEPYDFRGKAAYDHRGRDAGS